MVATRSSIDWVTSSPHPLIECKSVLPQLKGWCSPTTSLLLLQKGVGEITRYFQNSLFSAVLTDLKSTLPPPPPPPTTPQPRQETLPNIDPRLGFFNPHPPSTPSPIPPQHEALTQSLSSHTAHRAPTQQFVTAPSVHPPSSYPPPPDMDPNPNSGDSGSEVDENDEPDIDERSDGEDDRAAHKLLHAAPIVTRDFTNPLTILPYNHQGFAVS